METYRCNRSCGCLRCRYRGIMGPVVLMTLGVLFLLDNSHVLNLNFDRTWPLLLICIGIVLMMQRSASTEGHVQPYAAVPPFPAPPAQPMPGSPSSASSSVSSPMSSSVSSSEAPHE